MLTLGMAIHFSPSLKIEMRCWRGATALRLSDSAGAELFRSGGSVYETT
jgi:hypothetical protein